MDHFTFEGGGVKELVSARIFFSLVSGADNISRAIHAFFRGIFFILLGFFSCKLGFAGIFLEWSALYILINCLGLKGLKEFAFCHFSVPPCPPKTQI